MSRRSLFQKIFLTIALSSVQPHATEATTHYYQAIEKHPWYVIGLTGATLATGYALWNLYQQFTQNRSSQVHADKLYDPLIEKYQQERENNTIDELIDATSDKIKVLSSPFANVCISEEESLEANLLLGQKIIELELLSAPSAKLLHVVNDIQEKTAEGKKYIKDVMRQLRDSINTNQDARTVIGEAIDLLTPEPFHGITPRSFGQVQREEFTKKNSSYARLVKLHYDTLKKAPIAEEIYETKYRISILTAVNNKSHIPDLEKQIKELEILKTPWRYLSILPPIYMQLSSQDVKLTNERPQKAKEAIAQWLKTNDVAKQAGFAQSPIDQNNLPPKLLQYITQNATTKIIEYLNQVIKAKEENLPNEEYYRKADEWVRMYVNTQILVNPREVLD